MKRFSAVLVVAALAACSSPRPAPSSASAPASAPPSITASPAEDAEHTTMRPPFTLDLQGPADVRAGQTISVELRIHRDLPGNAPLRLTVDVPPGATLVSGPLEDKVVEGPDVVRRWDLVLQAVPERDLVVRVGLEEPGVTAHGSKAYSFGRVAPAPVRPRRGADVDGTGGAVPLD